MKMFRMMVVLFTLLVSLSSMAWASGGQHQGDKGKGEVVQTQVRK